MKVMVIFLNITLKIGEYKILNFKMKYDEKKLLYTHISLLVCIILEHITRLKYLE